MNALLPPAPPASDDATRSRMRRQARRDTGPERALRRLLHARGLRYRLDVRPLPELRRRADLVFTRARVAVFVDGCYWHACPQHGSQPAANAEWWRTKFARTVQRDRDTDARLAEAGWTVIRVWEHEDPVEAAERIVATLRSVRSWAYRKPRSE